MNAVPSRITPEDFEAALVAASQLDDEPRLALLAAPGVATIIGRIEEAWEKIQDLLRDAYERGQDALATARENAVLIAETAISEAGAAAGHVRQGLHDRVEKFIQGIVDRALGRVRGEIEVGGVNLRLSDLQVAQRIMLGGSIGASLIEACTMVTQGELSVTASYAVRDVTPS